MAHEETDRVREAVNSDWKRLLTAAGVDAGGLPHKGGLICCPFHEDDDPSCSLSFQGGNWRFKCFGCGRKGDAYDFYRLAFKIPDGNEHFMECVRGVAAIYGMAEAEAREPAGVVQYEPNPDRTRASRNGLPDDAVCVASYDYADEKGELLYQQQRFEWTREDGRHKSFRVRRPIFEVGWKYRDALDGVRRVPYRLPDLLKWEIAFLVEGEKKVEALRRLNLPATCIFGGASEWKPEHGYAAHFTAKTVYLIPDRDEPGQTLLMAAGADLLPVAKAVRVFQLTEYPILEHGGSDVADWIEEREKAGLPPETIRKELLSRMQAEARPFQKALEAPPAAPEPPQAPEVSPEPPDAAEATPAASGETKPGTGAQPASALQPIHAPPAPDFVSSAALAVQKIAANDKLPPERKFLAMQREIRRYEDLAGGKQPKPTAADLLRWPDPNTEPTTIEGASFVEMGATTGLMSLDCLTRGLRKGWWVIRGTSGHGKSTLCNMIVQASCEAGVPWLVIAFEDCVEEWRAMMLSRISGVPKLEITTGEYASPYNRERVTAALDKVAEIMVGITFLSPDTRKVRLPDLREMVDAWRERVCENKPGVGAILIDPIQRLTPSGPDESLYDRMEEAIGDCVHWVAAHKIPVLTTVHLNMNKQEKGTSGFEFSADIRLLIEEGKGAKTENDGLPDEDRRMSPYLDLVIEKNKGMPTGLALLRYHKARATWAEVVRQAPAPPPPPPPKEPRQLRAWGAPPIED